MGDYVHERDRDALFRFGNDTRVSATNFLALTEWHLGEFERARRLIDESTRRANELGHVASVASALFFKTVIEGRRGDDPPPHGSPWNRCVALTHEHNLKTYADLGEVYANWARGKTAIQRRGRLGSDRRWSHIWLKATRAARRRSTVCSQSLRPCGPIVEAALAAIDAGICDRGGDGGALHRPISPSTARRNLAQRDPRLPSPAEEAFQTAIAIAKGQGARGYALLASLSLAKLYQSTGRHDDAHAILAPALEGFSPTPEMPEIAEAQALLVAIEAGAHVRHE